MNIPDVPIPVEVDPNEDTEWNDILRKHGVIPEKPPSPTPMIEEALVEARRLAHENRLEGKDLDELDELEDDEDEDFLEQYRLVPSSRHQQPLTSDRKKRMVELSTITKASVFNQVYPVQKPDYSREVTEASQKAWVFVLLTASDSNVESRIAEELWRELARDFGDIKFCKMRGNLCIEGYPDKNCPTVLIYKDGDIKRQIVTLRELNGPRTSTDDIKKVLLDLGALQHSDPRLRRKDEEAEQQPKNIRQSRNGDDEDSDWD
ncbi:phosducin family protein [Phyllosticta citrichinensis]|uniref:Phosducin family protein n=1 Tax=Phyllosticta citrichinensis TaxID=1130410 RepID=A0ABR1XF68_9PEZI